MAWMTDFYNTAGFYNAYFSTLKLNSVFCFESQVKKLDCKALKDQVACISYVGDIFDTGQEVY